jgi:hypothetical protein
MSGIANVTKLYYRQGTSYARGTTIDAYLQDDDNTLLYEIWQPSWPEPFGFHGGEKAITAEMILEVPTDEFIKAFGRKKGNRAAALRILEAAKRNAGR